MRFESAAALPPGIADKDKQVKQMNVLWVASYPKSGNTWVHSVLRLAGKDHGFPQVDMDVYNLARSGVEPRECETVAERFKSRPCTVLKTHSIYREAQKMHKLPGVELTNAGFIHVYRNPLDVLLSYLNFTRLEYKAHADNEIYRKNLFQGLLGMEKTYSYDEWLGVSLDDLPRASLDHALDAFSEADMSIKALHGMSGSWLANTRSWLDASKEVPGFSVRYEDLLADPGQFARLAEMFALTPASIQTALDLVNTRARSVAVNGNQDQSVFYNKMASFYFSSYFSPEAVARFLARHESALREVGYSELLV
jgi:hypothetical protein